MCPLSIIDVEYFRKYTLSRIYTQIEKRKSNKEENYASHISFPIKMHVFFLNELNKVPPKQFGISFFLTRACQSRKFNLFVGCNAISKECSNKLKQFFFMKFVNVDNNRNKSKMNSAKKNWKQIRKRSYIQ